MQQVTEWRNGALSLHCATTGDRAKPGARRTVHTRELAIPHAGFSATVAAATMMATARTGSCCQRNGKAIVARAGPALPCTCARTGLGLIRRRAPSASNPRVNGATSKDAVVAERTPRWKGILHSELRSEMPRRCCEAACPVDLGKHFFGAASTAHVR